MAFDQRQYIRDYNQQNYKCISVLLPRGCKQEVASMANDYGLSITEFVLRAIEQKYHVDLRADDTD